MDRKHNPNLTPNARTLRKNMTKEERHLWYDFLQKYPIKFYKQRPIDNYIVDFYCKEVGLVIELDGLSHQYNEVMDLDERKQSYLESIGLKVIRFEDEDVIRDLPNVMRVIEYTALSLKPMKFPLLSGK